MPNRLLYGAFRGFTVLCLAVVLLLRFLGVLWLFLGAFIRLSMTSYLGPFLGPLLCPKTVLKSLL